MIADIVAIKRDFALDTYHEFVAWSLLHGFKWTRYQREGDYLTIYNLKFPHFSKAIPSKDVAIRYERWFKWMKRNARSKS